jgi:hypothetical protein
MMASLPAKIGFWAAICASCVWFVLTIAAGLEAGLRFRAGGVAVAGHTPFEFLIASVFALQPFVILFLIVRAIRHRREGPPSKYVIRALYPLAPVLFLVGYIKALGYLVIQSERRLDLRRANASVIYVCSFAHQPQQIGSPVLKLMERRHPGQLSSWTIAWPGMKPIAAASFETSTAAFGGSQGLAWKDSDGRPMIAYVSFSDLIDMHGPMGVLVQLVQSDVRDSTPGRDKTGSPNFDCKSDPASYRE